MSGGICPWGKCLGSTCPGRVVLFAEGVSVQGVNVLGGKCPGGKCPGGIYPRGYMF